MAMGRSLTAAIVMLTVAVADDKAPSDAEMVNVFMPVSLAAGI